MLATTKQLIANQFEAALCTLNICIDRCRNESWKVPVGNLPFCQVVFHTLFFTDYYLEPDSTAFREQPFHRDNEAFFRDYEQLEYRKPISLYYRPDILRYMEHCRSKASGVIASETAESLVETARFGQLDFSRAELHVYSIRHIQHHAAQLSLRLRLDAKEDIPWIDSGWSSD